MEKDKKITDHIHRPKEGIIGHIQKYKDRYTAWSWYACGIGAIKVIVVVWIFLMINMMSGQIDIIQEKLRVYQTLETMISIDDIAHQELTEDVQENPFTEADKKTFIPLDTAYHTAINLNRKYIAAKKMVDFLSELETRRPKATGANDTDAERDKTYRELLMRFYNTIR